MCLQHTPLGGRRCERCEDSFAKQIATLPLWAWRTAGFVMALPITWLLTKPLLAMFHGKIWAWGALTAGLAAVDAAIMIVGLGAGLAFAAGRLVVAWKRRRFLTQSCMTAS